MQLSVLDKQTYIYTAGHGIDPALPAIVFIHGGEQDHSAWALQSRYFAYHGYNAIVPDLPGHGRSAGPPLGSVEAAAQWIAKLLQAMAVTRAAIVGHSMGALIALELAAMRPAQVSSIALLGVSTPMPVAEPLLAAGRADDPRALDMINIWSHSPRAQLGGNTVPGLWMTGMQKRLMERQAAGVLYADFKACNDYAGGVGAATKVGCPTLVIAGSRDQMTPASAGYDVAKRIAGAQVVTIEGSGHALLAEAPDAVLDAIKDFVV
jgi:pimeloyl-ACP methyl ester carboxylesterase